MKLTQSKKDKIRILKEEIKMIKSHQNVSNWDLMENMMAARILLIMELEGSNLCLVCETPCGNDWCSTNGGKDD